MRGFFEEGGIEEGEAEAFGNGGGDEVAGALQPGFKTLRVVAHNVELNGEICLLGEADPVIVDEGGFF